MKKKGSSCFNKVSSTLSPHFVEGYIHIRSDKEISGKIFTPIEGFTRKTPFGGLGSRYNEKINHIRLCDIIVLFQLAQQRSIYTYKALDMDASPYTKSI